MRPDLLLARLDLIEAARPSVDYCRANGIDFAATAPACGGVVLAEVRQDGQHVAACPGGLLAAWCDVLVEDAETVIDTVAWPVDQPAHWWTLGGGAPALGMAAAENPATYALGFPLRLHRTPLAWLQARCDGAVILDRAAGARWLLDLPPGRIAPEDRAHADDLAASMNDLLDLRRFVVPRQRKAA